MEAFPVKANIDGTEHRGLKMIADTDSAVLYRWDRQRQTGVPVLTVDAVPQIVKPGRSWTLAADDGTVTVYKDSGCGCGSKLKRWRPKVGTAARA